VFESGFQFEFDKGRFPLRCFLFGFILTAIALLFSHGNELRTSLSFSEILTVFSFVAIYISICLLLLWSLRDFIVNMKPGRGIILGWIVVDVAAFVVCVALVYLHDSEGFKFLMLDTQYLTAEVGFSIFLFTVLLTPFLLWVEKKIYSDKAAFLASESEQFSNLGFRIRPHFLFNSLNSVAGLIPRNPTRAETALYNLADVFRAVMADKRQLVPLKAELDLADKYLFLEKIRLGDRLEISSKIDPNAVGVKVPVFLLQPLLENAVYHGIEARFKGGKISLNIQLKKNVLIIKITNPLPDVGVKRKTGNKVAQQNLRLRVIAIFGKGASLDSYEAETSFNVIVRLPL
jgi:two-component system sensor histidine kinase AlgZ